MTKLIHFVSEKDQVRTVYVHPNTCRYTTEGRDVLSQIKNGDKILSAKLVQGKERLVLPQEQASPVES
jgi:hypothetical protein